MGLTTLLGIGAPKATEAFGFKKQDFKIPPPKAPPATPKETDPEVMRKAADQRRKLLAQLGRRGTILTKPSTLGQPSIRKATVLGDVV